MPEATAVETMFAGIARRYDAANHILSGGIDFAWRSFLVKQVCLCKPIHIIDLATGSGDVAFALARKISDARITGMDFCEPMLDEARNKQKRLFGDHSKISFEHGDALALPLNNACADVVTIAFGIRNFADRPRAYSEIARVLKPGGHLFILEFSQPFAWFRPIYYFYLKGILPLLAMCVTGDRNAYEYLGGSIESFPTRSALTEELLNNGFTRTNACPLTFGVVAVHHCQTLSTADSTAPDSSNSTLSEQNDLGKSEGSLAK